MSTSEIVLTQNETTTAMEVDQGLATDTIIIIIATLGGLIVVLSIILIIVYCRPKDTKHRARSTEWIGPQTNMSFESGFEDDPVYRASVEVGGRVNSAAYYSDVDEVAPEVTARVAISDPLSRESYAEVDISCPIPRPTSTATQNSDYENAAGIVYENCSSPTSPTTTDSNPPLPAKRSSTDKKSKQNMFREGTKAYHLYGNALQDYEIPRKHIQLLKRIGKGNFSTVHSGLAAQLPYSNEQNKQVAIKTLKSSASDSDKQEFLYEFEIMKLTNSLKHENITRLLASVTKSQPRMLILELMPLGNLRNFLRASRSQDVYYNLHGNSNCISERQLLQFAIDIANGMEGIAQLQLLHRDLAARNILVDTDLRCKISDFGFAKDILNKPEYKSKSVLRRARPVRWLAPESLIYFKHSILSDVWSYGIVLWEIVTLGNLPYPDMKVKDVQYALSQMYRMPCPTHCSPELYRIMAWCWEQNPTLRPCFHQLAGKMRKLLENATRIIDMQRIEDDDYIDVLPTDEAVVFMDYGTDTSC
ncbi:tyrosine kinase receptor Cad96Ca-like [Watersipora subatra]|uniref:tyrosine kinase receptor Cad96Ca-like n=1 Tax=Watersipora subatra TaxID=2589382 RepID=UPI00355C2D73